MKYKFINSVLDRNNIPYTMDYSLFGIKTFVISSKDDDIRICSDYDSYYFKCYDYVRLSGFGFDSGCPYHLFELEDVLLAKIKGTYKVGHISNGLLMYAIIGHQGMDPLEYKKYFEQHYNTKVLSISSFDLSINLRFY